MRLLTGVVGVGKSTVADGLTLEGLRVRNLGSLMFEIAAADNLVATRDELRELTPEARQRLRMTALQQVDPGDVLDVHLSVRTSGRLEPSFPKAAWRDVSHCVILEASPAAIVARRMRRAGRQDEPDSMADVQEQQAFNRQLATAADGLVRYVTLVQADRPPADVIRDTLVALRQE